MSTQVFWRGGTVYWTTTFYNPQGDVVQPSSATINVDAPAPDGSRTQQSIAMTAPTDPDVVTWNAFLDTRGMGTGPVFWSIHTPTPIPVSVEDGTFNLTANAANLVTFT